MRTITRENHCFTITFDSSCPHWVDSSMRDMTNMDIIKILLSQIEDYFHATAIDTTGLSAAYIYQQVFCIPIPSREIYKYVWFDTDTFEYAIRYDDRAQAYLINFYGATDITEAYPIPYLMHKRMGCGPLSEYKKAYDIAIDYLRSQSKLKG